jgi:acetoin utilization protein AcuC
MAHPVCVYRGKALARYNFGETHPFGPKRHDAFVGEFNRRHLDARTEILAPVSASEEQVLWFHQQDYVSRVKALSKTGKGMLDWGDTPAFKGMWEASLAVVGSTLDGVDHIMAGNCQRAFNPIGGMHHAQRDTAAGFCVFNDCAIAIEALRRVHSLECIAYVDIDAHHGDGVYYSYERDPEVYIADLHEDGRYLYPGTGARYESGEGEAKGTKLNIPMPMEAGDDQFMAAWERVEDFVDTAAPEFILLQCGADSLAGDPLTHLKYSVEAHRHAATRLCKLADKHCQGRLMVMGGGGYDLDNLASAWCTVVEALVDNTA